MVTKLEEEDDDDGCCDCNNNNNNNNGGGDGGDNKKNKKWFMCDITFFCKVEDKLLGKTYTIINCKRFQKTWLNSNINNRN